LLQRHSHKRAHGGGANCDVLFSTAIIIAAQGVVFALEIDKRHGSARIFVSIEQVAA